MQDPRHDEEDHIQNLDGAEAVAKMKDLAKGARTCFFTTLTESRPLPTRPMALQAVEDDGSFYFFSAASSNKNFEIAEDAEVQLFFADTGSSGYLSIFGRASVITDRAKMEELWNAWAKAWFSGGVDDPDLTLIRVRPENARYWDTKHGKLVMLLKVAASIVTGKTKDDAVEGSLNV